MNAPIGIFSLFLSALFFVAPIAEAGQGGSGASVRGGAVAVWLHGRWTMKETLRKSARGGQSLQLSENVREAIADDVRPMVSAYAGDADGEYWNLVLDEAADYRLVDRLPCPATNEKLARGERNLGCTIGQTTYFVRSLFAQFDNRTRILAILHERGHAVDPSDRAHDWILPFIDAVDVLLRLADEQERGKWRALTPDELDRLTPLVANPEIDRRLGGDPALLRTVRVISAQGGGVIRSDSARPLRRLDVRIGSDSFLGAGSTLNLASATCGTPMDMIRGTVWLAERTKVQRSRVDCTAFTRSTVVDSTIARVKEETDAFQHPNYVEDSVLKGTRLFAPATYLVYGSTLERSLVDFAGDQPLLIRNSKLDGAQFFTPEEFSWPGTRSRMHFSCVERVLKLEHPGPVDPWSLLKLDPRS